jgi:hypothetical protein
MLVFELEERPRLVLLARPEDESRLMDWLDRCGDPRIREMLEAAVRLVTEPRPERPRPPFGGPGEPIARRTRTWRNRNERT